MTEPAFQVSDKIGDAIIVVRGTNAAEFAHNLQAFASDAGMMNAVNAFSGAVKGATPQQAYQQVQQTLGAQPVQQQAPWDQQPQAPWQGQPQQQAAPSTPTCKHGPRTYKSGQSAKGPWEAWMCTAKGDDRCKAMNPDGTLWAR